jgi:hypothetical protein
MLLSEYKMNILFTVDIIFRLSFHAIIVWVNFGALAILWHKFIQKVTGTSNDAVHHVWNFPEQTHASLHAKVTM